MSEYFNDAIIVKQIDIPDNDVISEIHVINKDYHEFIKIRFKREFYNSLQYFSIYYVNLCNQKYYLSTNNLCVICRNWFSSDNINDEVKKIIDSLEIFNEFLDMIYEIRYKMQSSVLLPEKKPRYKLDYLFISRKKYICIYRRCG